MGNNLMLISTPFYMNCGLVMVTCNKIKQFRMLVVMFAQLHVAVGQIRDAPRAAASQCAHNEWTVGGGEMGIPLVAA